jgi:hypothetical protein
LLKRLVEGLEELTCIEYDTNLLKLLESKKVLLIAVVVAAEVSVAGCFNPKEFVFDKETSLDIKLLILTYLDANGDGNVDKFVV